MEKRLINAVRRQLGSYAKEDMRNVVNHGASAGFHGFTYYSDTVAFFKRHRKAIVALVEERATDMGENPADMVAGFNCLAGRERDKAKLQEAKREVLPSVSRCLYGGHLSDKDETVANALAWFALEEVSRHCNPDL